jgi:hypothetical protein
LKKLVLLVFLLAAPGLIWSQARKYSNAFLEIGVDARAMAMSQAVVASTHDVNAGYWNPAGLAGLESWEASAMHASYFASIAQYDYLSYAQPLPNKGALGVSLIRFGVDDILNTTQLINEQGEVDYDRITRFSAADYALLASYARQAPGTPGLRYGGNVKIVYRQIGKFANAIGFGFDLGLQYRRGPWQMGAMLRDATTTFNAWRIDEDQLADVFDETGNELPTENLELTLPRLLLGLGRSFSLGDDYHLHTEMNLDFSFGGRTNTLVSSEVFNMSPNLGVELDFRRFVFLRLGAGQFKRLRRFSGAEYITVQPNLGLGFRYRGFQIDYALTDIAGASGAFYSNVFSLKFNFAEFNDS